MLAQAAHSHSCLAKFAVDPEDIDHEHQVLACLLESPPVPGIVSPVQLVSRKGEGVILLAEAGWL
jgi:hypothetical protein